MITPPEEHEVFELVYRPYSVAVTTADELHQDLERCLSNGGPLVVRARGATVGSRLRLQALGSIIDLVAIGIDVPSGEP